MTSEQIKHPEQSEHAQDGLTWSRMYNDLDKTHQKALFWIVAVGFGPILLLDPLDDNTTGEWVWGVGTALFYIGIFGLSLTVNWIRVLSDIGVLVWLSRAETIVVNTVMWLIGVLNYPGLYAVVLLLSLSILVSIAYELGGTND